MWGEMDPQLHFSAGGYLVVPAALVEQTLFFSNELFWYLAKNKLFTLRSY
jgi:hypothetical protein